MEVLQAIVTALGSIITLFILTKIMGNREMSQLTMFDYINGITIGSIAAEMATTEFTDLTKPFVAMIVYALVVTASSKICEKSFKARRIIAGKSSILYDNGIIFVKNLKKAKMDLNEFLSQCRIGGYFQLSTLQTVILESNGKLSFLPISTERPVTGKDLQLQPQQDHVVANVIMDGKIMYDNLKHTGKDENWLNKQLKVHQVQELSQVLLATCDSQNTLNVYIKNPSDQPYDILE
ncbi:DUF421 domain-containing protein [Anaerosporobacter faecicola]|uniref:DUF421 domain-containing protein n=1 Tax=Anaerosporobacter faecicola TaxID=2718714 RepID=UPI00143BE478|nr:DUF421 domain-containing protein [Anaerosporobacter faecicola]